MIIMLVIDIYVVIVKIIKMKHGIKNTDLFMRKQVRGK